MSLQDKEILRLNQWLHDFEEGTLAEVDLHKLEQLLSSNEEARKYYVQRGFISSALHHMADEAHSAQGQKFRGVKRVNYWLAASLLTCILLTGLLLFNQWNKLDAIVELKDDGCAILVDAVNAVWEGGVRPVGLPVAAETLRLKSGLARLEFYSGASVTMEGPCYLRVVAVNEAHCEKGRVRVHVSPHARGFKLGTPDARVVDLGTEFGLLVDDAGKSQVHVFDGEVEVYPDQADDQLKLNLITAQRWDGGRQISTQKAQADAFVDMDALRVQSSASASRRLNAWRVGMSEVLNDSRLVVGYTFDPESEWERRLPNLAPKPIEGSHGSIVGARWVDGRWKGKRSLQFKSPGDRVRVRVDESFPSITLCAWVSVDGVDRPWNSLFLTDGFETGNPHWQIERDGRVVLGVRRDKGSWSQDIFRAPALFNAENLGIWYHLAVTFDLRTGIGRHFVNGRLVGEHHEPDIPPGTLMHIGMAELGNWGLKGTPTNAGQIRNFNGRMDEFLFYREALAPEEITKIYELGRPE